jgi:hypothetical protein
VTSSARAGDTRFVPTMMTVAKPPYWRCILPIVAAAEPGRLTKEVLRVVRRRSGILQPQDGFCCRFAADKQEVDR